MEKVEGKTWTDVEKAGLLYQRTVKYGGFVWWIAVVVTRAGAVEFHSLEPLMLRMRRVGKDGNWRR